MTKLLFTILSLFLTFNAFAGGAKISELQKEAKADNDGKLFLEELHNLNAPNAINPVSLSDKSIVGKKSFRFEVNHGECGQEPKFSDCENERERSELYYQWKSNEFGKAKNEQWKKEKWYRFFVFIPIIMMTIVSTLLLQTFGTSPDTNYMSSKVVDASENILKGRALACSLQN